ncbi:MULTISPECIES: BMP family lipoprotein [Pseudobutyrivibrio]|uniref:Basic membrane protein A n=1 Tax=Pseudobutyrivibrio xylanivorans TaxID=185007 RepID=A0A1G5S1G6_PSEXY|nr:MULTISPECIES: BMP family ABC transporter substrate-binding protein [Pseudobutyrivibrio]MDC7280480.1 BMP family ABC transporter substrate-binding protein [Butyrivibrio fibrisolvens]SCZ80153.1 basic membrane protein A [Pseudobutyrivibrio xylanivorans]
MKKKLLSVLLVASMVATMFVGCGSSSSSDSASDATATTEEGAADAAGSDYKIAMITDSGDITDMSFNQTTYEASKAFAEKNGVDFQYYKPTEDSDDARVASFENAVTDGYNVIVVPGYLFAGMIAQVAADYPNVTIIALDCGEGDFSGAGMDSLPENVCSFTYQEELAGYMAGYAAVKEGYKKLGFLGGMAVPAVIRYGFGFVQGADAAAVELGNASEVEVNYVYGGQFYGDDAVTAQMDTWYSNGTEVVFACGGGIYTSACEAATKVDGKVIGVDVDQSGTIENAYGVEGLCITSAMKGLAATVDSTLTDLFAGNWSKYSGKIENLGIVSGDDPSLNYVQLPMDTWTMKNFTVDDYKALVASMNDGTVKVSNSTDAMPKTSIKVTEFDNIH